MSNFKLSGVGLDTSCLNFSPSTDCKNPGYVYIHTDLSSNNDFLIKDYVSKVREQYKVSLVTTTRFMDQVEQAIFGHLAELGVPHIDLLFIDAKCDLEKYQDVVAKLIDTGVVKNIGISDPSDLGLLLGRIEFLKTIGVEVGSVALNICPLSFDPDLVKYCEDSGIFIFGFNQFGGHLSAPTLIDSFTVPYLLNFSAFHCDVVFLSSRNIYESYENRDYLENLIERKEELEVKNPEIYQVAKKINQLRQPIKKIVYSGVKIFSDTPEIFPISDPGYVFDPAGLEMSLGKRLLPNVTPAEPDSDLDKAVYTVYQTFHRPEDGGEAEFFSIIRHKILDLIRAEHKDWTVSVANVSNRAIFISTEKETIVDGGWFKKDDVKQEKDEYFLYFLNGTFVFRKL